MPPTQVHRPLLERVLRHHHRLPFEPSAALVPFANGEGRRARLRGGGAPAKALVAAARLPPIRSKCMLHGLAMPLPSRAKAGRHSHLPSPDVPWFARRKAATTRAPTHTFWRLPQGGTAADRLDDMLGCAPGAVERVWVWWVWWLRCRQSQSAAMEGTDLWARDALQPSVDHTILPQVAPLSGAPSSLRMGLEPPVIGLPTIES